MARKQTVTKEETYNRQNKWVSAERDRVLLVMPKGEKQKILLCATATGQSVNSFIFQAIQNEISRLRFRYGMRLRGFSPGCQPKEGFVERQDDETGKYHDILIYHRPLTDKELTDYELDYIGGES